MNRIIGKKRVVILGFLFVCVAVDVLDLFLM